MAGSNMEKFIIDLGFSDAKAVKGLKDFIKQVEKLKVNINPTASSKTSKPKTASEDKLKKDSAKADFDYQQALHMNKVFDQKKLQKIKNEGEREAYKQQLAMDRARASRAKSKNSAEKAAYQQQIRMDTARAKSKSDAEKAAYLQQSRMDRARIKAKDDAEKASQRASNTRRRTTEAEAYRIEAQLSRFKHSRAMEETRKYLPKDEGKSNKIARGLIMKGSAESARELDALTRSMTAQAAAAKKLQNRTKSLNVAQRGLSDSTKHLVRSYASVFAVLAGTNAINKTGQSFEALNSAMLAAMGTPEEAAKQIEFLDKMTSRLGMSLIDTADQYTKFTFASKGKLPTEEVNFLFQSMSEMGTVLGVSKERMKLSFTAIQQINIFRSA